MVRAISRSVLLLPVALLCGVASLAAQRTGADTSAPAAQGYAPQPSAAPGAPALTSAESSAITAAILLPVRSEAALEQALSVTQGALSRADSQLTLVSARRTRTDKLIQGRQRQLSEIEAMKRQADREKRKADKSALEAQKKAVERQKALAEEFQTLNDTEIEAAKKAREAAIARQQALDLERQLVDKGDRSAVVIRELERQTLAAQKKAAGLEHDLAGKLAFLSSRRLDLYREYLESNQPGR